MPGVDAKATFAVGLETQDLVKPGDEAAQVLERLKGKIMADVKALADMNAAMKNLKGGTAVNVSAFRDLKERMDKQRQSIAAAQGDFLKLGGRLGDLSKKAVTASGKGGIKSLSDAASAAGGPLGRVLLGAAGLKLALSGAALAAIAVAAAVVAVGVAVAAATVKMASFALASADARRSELLQLQGLTTIRNWFGIAAGKATDLQDAIDKVSDSSAIGRDKIVAYSRQLYQMGFRGANLSDALEATAIKASVQGEEFAGAFMAMAAGANAAGGSVRRMAEDVRARLGGIAKAQALSLTVQVQKLHENLARLFSGIPIEGFLSALGNVLSLFSQTSYTGRALKQILEVVFTPLSNAAAALGPVMRKFFFGMILAGLDFLIVVFKIRNWFRDTFGNPKLFKGLDFLAFAMTMGKIAAIALIAAVVTVGAVVAVVAALWVGAWMVIIKAVELVWSLIKGLGELLGGMVFLFVSGLKELWGKIADIDWAGLGKAIVQGLANGITGASKWVVDAVSGLAGKAKKEFMNLLGIHSPSRVFFKLGGFVGEGFAQGLDAGAPRVNRSIGYMIDAPAASAAAAGTSSAGAGARGAAGASVTIHELHYHSSGSGNHQADAEDFKTKLAQVLEAVSIQMAAS